MENSSKKIRIAFFDAKPYDIDSFTKISTSKEFIDEGLSFDFYKDNLTFATAPLAANHEAVCIFVNDRLDEDLIQHLYDLGVRFIALRSAGTSYVNLKAAKGKIKIVNIPEYSAHSVAEFSVALLQTFNRKIQKTFVLDSEIRFCPTFGSAIGTELFGKTVGIIGGGRIGKIAAQIFCGYGSEVIMNDPVQDQNFAKTLGFRYANQEEIFRTSDYVCLYCPLTAETRNIINNNSISLMKKTCVIVSVGRPALIDHQVLYTALAAGRIRGAAIESFEEDSVFDDDWEQNSEDEKNFARLSQLPNVLMTKHQAYLTADSLDAIAERTIKNILEFVSAESISAENSSAESSDED